MEIFHCRMYGVLHVKNRECVYGPHVMEAQAEMLDLLKIRVLKISLQYTESK